MQMKAIENSMKGSTIDSGYYIISCFIEACDQTTPETFLFFSHK